jgi:hypothetical protein
LHSFICNSEEAKPEEPGSVIVNVVKNPTPSLKRAKPEESDYRYAGDDTLEDVKF